MKNIFIFILLTSLLMKCENSSMKKMDENEDASAMATGDEQAITLAKRVVNASGGIENWNKVHYISFDYFGSRYWFWDKQKNRYRVESEKRKYRIAGSLDGKETHLWLRGNIMTDADSLSKYKEVGYKAWINDTYWLIMPLKLLDKGVVLHYVGDCIFDSTKQATCLDLTFQNVGVTPENKYRIYIDTTSNEVVYWDFYNNKNDSLPTLSNPWTDYKLYGKINLSSGRGDDRGLEQIEIDPYLPDQIFKDVSHSFKEILKKD